MTGTINNINDIILVAIDIAKIKNDVLIEQPDRRRKKLIVANTMQDFEKFVNYLTLLGNNLWDVDFDYWNNFYFQVWKVEIN